MLISLAFRPRFHLLAFLAAFLSCGPFQGRAETTITSGATAITSVPYNVTQSGTYYLAADFTVSNQNAIVITADNVTVDFNGHTVTDSYGPAALSTGVYITANHATVMNGRVQGFTDGVTTVGNGCRVENMTVDRATFGGILSPGADTLIRRCRVTNTGGNTVYSNPDTYGILVYNVRIRIVDCSVSGVTPNSGGNGYGIAYFASGGGMVVGNRLSSCSLGLYMDPTCKYRDNLCTGSVTTAYAGGTDAGNNQ